MSLMQVELICFAAFVVVCAVCLLIFWKIEPEDFGIYAVWVLIWLVVAALLYRPWRIF